VTRFFKEAHRIFEEPRDILTRREYNQSMNSNEICKHEQTRATCSVCKPAYLKELRNFKPVVTDAHKRADILYIRTGSALESDTNKYNSKGW
jgi:hypothetical protein